MVEVWFWIHSVWFGCQQDKQKEFADVTLESATGDAGDLPKIRAIVRKALKGHINKVTSCHYSGDSRSYSTFHIPFSVRSGSK